MAKSLAKLGASSNLTHPILTMNSVAQPVFPN
jgi:hypothetical protein